VHTDAPNPTPTPTAPNAGPRDGSVAARGGGADPRPAHPGLPETTGLLAAELRAFGACELGGPDDLPLRRIDALDDAGEGSVSFVRDAAFAERWPASAAAAVIVSRGVDLPEHPDPRRAVLVVDHADAAVLALLGRVSARLNAPNTRPGVHPTAVVDPDAAIDPSATIGPLCTVGPRAAVGPGAVLDARVAVGADCRVGARTRLHEGVALRPMTTVGHDTLIHPGVVIGADGFGFDRDPAGVPVHIPHVAGVTVGDRVVIGANCAIDRGKLDDTIIGDDVKIDNLTQIGHGTRVGRATVICGCCAIGGSCRIGAFVTIGGGAHFPDNITIEDHTVIAGGSFLAGNADANDGEPWMGHPARPRGVWLRELRAVKTVARLRQDLKRTVRTVDRLADRLGDLDGKADPGDAPANP